MMDKFGLADPPPARWGNLRQMRFSQILPSAQSLSIAALVPSLGVTSVSIMVPTLLALILFVVYGTETRGLDLRHLEAHPAPRPRLVAVSVLGRNLATALGAISAGRAAIFFRARAQAVLFYYRNYERALPDPCRRQ